MDRLSGLDAMFLHLETPTQPLNVCAVIELDTSTMPTGYRYEDFRDRLIERLGAVAPFRLKLGDSPLNLDHPVWIPDDDFDPRRHIRRVGVPAPGGSRELAEVCSMVASGPLSRERPLWELWIIEGVDRSGSLAVMLKAHHAAIDGVGAAALLAQLCDATSEPSRNAPATLPSPLSTRAIAWGGLQEMARRPLRTATALLATASTAWHTLDRARRGVAMAAPFAGSTVFNGSFTSRRSLAFTGVSLADVKAVKDRFGVTVNDVITALCAGALRGFLCERGEALPERLVAAVPVAVHDQSDRPGRNQASWLLTTLRIDVEDPVERLRLTASQLANAKGHNAEIAPTLVMDWTQSVTPTVMRALRRIALNVPVPMRPAFHLILSNVPGPQIPLYMVGARLTAIHPFGPILAGSALNITAMSLDGKVGIGVTSCPDVIDDVWGLATRFGPAMRELLDASAASAQS